MRIRYSAFMLITILFFTVGLVAQTVSFSISDTALAPGGKGSILARLQIPDGQKQAMDPADPAYFYLEATHPDLAFGKVIYPKADKMAADGEWQYYRQVSLKLPFTVKANAKPGKSQILAELNYNLCYEDGMCNPPESEEGKLAFEILAVAAGAENVAPEAVERLEDEVQIESPELEADVTETAEVGKESAERSGWQEIIKYLLFAFLGGLILNITPCVLPILPIRIMSIINQADKDRSKVFRHVMIYTLGVLISFGVLAGIFIGIQMAGETAGWGTQNQNPYFTVTLLSIVFVFALSLLGIFEITAPGMDTANKATTRGGYSGSFFGGIFAFLMAISCTGPFLGAALPFAMGLAPLLILLFFLMIGLGFAFPFILIGLFPKALKIIPKPGNWMVLFKELMGFVLLYLVFTMLKTAFALTSGAYLLNLIWFLLILGFAVWLYGKYVRFEYSKTTQWIFTILPVILIIAAAWLYLPVREDQKPVANVEMAGSELVAAPNTPAGWYIFSPQLHEKLLADGKPVFLDIGAEWCKNCKTNEKTVLFTQEIMQDFDAKGVVLLKGDFTKKDPVLLDWITKHKRLGVPFNALYIPGMEPTIFPELISKNMIREALSKIPQGD